MVDLDSDPTKILEVVEIGKQLLITRGRPDDLLHCQRYCKVFRYHPRHVYDGDPAAECFEHHAPGDTLQCDFVGADLQRHYYPMPDSPGHERA